MAVRVGENILRFAPERRAAVLLGINREGNARDAAEWTRGGIFQRAGELHELRHAGFRGFDAASRRDSALASPA